MQWCSRATASFVCWQNNILVEWQMSLFIFSMSRWEGWRRVRMECLHLPPASPISHKNSWLVLAMPEMPTSDTKCLTPHPAEKEIASSCGFTDILSSWSMLQYLYVWPWTGDPQKVAYIGIKVEHNCNSPYMKHWNDQCLFSGYHPVHSAIKMVAMLTSWFRRDPCHSSGLQRKF